MRSMTPSRVRALPALLRALSAPLVGLSVVLVVANLVIAPAGAAAPFYGCHYGPLPIDSGEGDPGERALGCCLAAALAVADQTGFVVAPRIWAHSALHIAPGTRHGPLGAVSAKRIRAPPAV